LAMKSVWKRGRADLKPNKAVAAAASEPSSLTSMKDLWTALDRETWRQDKVIFTLTLNSK